MFVMIDPEAQAEENFKWKEVMCNCGKAVIPKGAKPIQRRRMQKLRGYFETKYGYCYVIVDVWHRCKTCNDKLIALYNAGKYPNQPSKTSLHLEANACDIHVFVKRNKKEKYWELKSGEVAEGAREVGFNNIGKYNTFTHVGSSDKPYYEFDNRK